LTSEQAAMSQRFFEGTQHATLYAKSRPSAPPRLAEKIISFLKEKVFFKKFVAQTATIK
jgi:hypothetical protein